MAARAVELAGFNPLILSKKRKSEMYGAQYLHRPIPGMSAVEPFVVKYVLNGSVDVYRDKVYGAGYRGQVSPEDLQETHEGWDIRTTYSNLWARFQDKIHNVPFENGHQVIDVLTAIDSAHYISSIPAPMLCVNPAHQFSSQTVWAVGDAPERGIFSPITTELNTVTCSGEKDTSWYRVANILGYHTAEWPANKRPPIEGIQQVTKPLTTNCDCHPSIHRVGRYGKWQKGVLSHEAYYETEAGLGAEVSTEGL